MCAPVAVAMPIPAKLPITSAKIDSFCEAKMPVAPGSKPRKRSSGPKNSRPNTSSTRMVAMKPKAMTATQHSPLCQASISRRTFSGGTANPGSTFSGDVPLMRRPPVPSRQRRAGGALQKWIAQQTYGEQALMPSWIAFQ